MSATKARMGRRPGAPETREQLLAAARQEFAAKGFRGATTRAIAEAAEVDIALIAHYFGDKQGLFDAALELPAHVRAAMGRALSGEAEDAGEHLTRTYLGLWEDEATRAQLLAIVRSAMGGGEAMDRLRSQLVGAVQGACQGQGERQQIGLLLATSHLLGVALARYVAEMAPLAGLSFDKLVELVAPAVRLHLIASR